MIKHTKNKICLFTLIFFSFSLSAEQTKTSVTMFADKNFVETKSDCLKKNANNSKSSSQKSCLDSDSKSIETSTENKNYIAKSKSSLIFDDIVNQLKKINEEKKNEKKKDILILGTKGENNINEKLDLLVIWK